MSWWALAAIAVLQLLAGVVRVRAWFHVIRDSWPEAVGLRYRDVALAHLGGVGWNAVLPARTGDAVKVVIVDRRMPERRLAFLAATTVPPAVVEAAFTAVLLAGLVVTSIVSFEALADAVPSTGIAVVVAAAVAVALAAVACRMRRILCGVRAGLSALGRPRVIALKVVPWLLLARALRLLSYALLLPALGLPLELGAALALMALQGATPSAGAAASAARIALLSAVLAATGAAHVPAEQVAAALAAAYGVTSALNVTVSAAAIAWLLRTVSPRRIGGYVFSSLRTVREPVRP